MPMKQDTAGQWPERKIYIKTSSFENIRKSVKAEMLIPRSIVRMTRIVTHRELRFPHESGTAIVSGKYMLSFREENRKKLGIKSLNGNNLTTKIISFHRFMELSQDWRHSSLSELCLAWVGSHGWLPPLFPTAPDNVLERRIYGRITKISKS